MGQWEMVNGLDAAAAMMPIRPRNPFEPEHQALPDHPKQDDLRAAGLSLLFRPGARPTAQDIARLVDEARKTGLSARISHLAADGEGWLELLASGLTFDLRGLAPAAPAPVMTDQQSFGFGPDRDDCEACEAVEMVPSGHIVAGAALQPVLRTMMGLAANLVLQLPGVEGIAWHPAGTVMEPRYFSRLVLAWLGGGAFPALGLTSLHRAADGSVASRGLAHFIGQEVQLEGRAGEDVTETMKLAVRVVDHLVRHGRIAKPERIGSAEDGLLAEPSQVGGLVLVWREA